MRMVSGAFVVIIFRLQDMDFIVLLDNKQPLRISCAFMVINC